MAQLGCRGSWGCQHPWLAAEQGESGFGAVGMLRMGSGLGHWELSPLCCPSCTGDRAVAAVPYWLSLGGHSSPRLEKLMPWN